MGVELILYLYGAVCLCMIVFNVVCALLLRGSDSRLQRRAARFRQAAERQLARLAAGKPVEQRHLLRLQRKLCRSKNLIAFDRMLRALRETGETADGYLAQLQPCLLHLALVYQRRESTQAAYFSYFLSRYILPAHLPIQSLQEVLLDYLARDNLYCRVNALQALYAFGSIEHIVTALHVQDRSADPLHDKILTEGLLTFTGDHRALIAQLWRELDSFTPHTRLAILNYIRLRSGDYAPEMFALMTDDRADKELRLAAIRYFGRYPYDRAAEPLLAFAADSDPARWEYATVSASALAHYPGGRVIDTLKAALHSSNWYVRAAASASLEAHHLSYEDLMDIVSGNDRYAREMMTYQLEARRIQNAEV